MSVHKPFHSLIWQRYLGEDDLVRKTSYYKQYYPLKKQTIERVFEDGKEKQGFRFSMYPGISKAQDYM